MIRATKPIRPESCGRRRRRRARQTSGAVFVEALIVIAPMTILWGACLYLGALYSKQIAVAQTTRECVFEKAASLSCDFSGSTCGVMPKSPPDQGPTDLDPILEEKLDRLEAPTGGFFPFLINHATPRFTATATGRGSSSFTVPAMFSSGSGSGPVSLDATSEFACNEDIPGRRWSDLSVCNLGITGAGAPALCDDAWYAFVEVMVQDPFGWVLDSCVTVTGSCTSTVGETFGLDGDSDHPEVLPANATDSPGAELYAGEVGVKQLTLPDD